MIIYWQGLSCTCSYFALFLFLFVPLIEKHSVYIFYLLKDLIFIFAYFPAPFPWVGEWMWCLWKLKRILAPLDLVLEAVGSHLMWVLGVSQVV